MANSTPVWHNIFRNIVLKPDNITFEAETIKDTLNILRGPGVAWQGSSDIDTVLATGSDTFMINVDYDISVPVATTDITLEDVNGNTSSITFTAGRGIEIVRNSAQELEWRSYSVTETDTLQTVTERNNITNNKIFINNIEVGTVSSSFTEDGFPSYDAGHNLIGDGTLDDPLQFSPEYQDSLMANNTDQFEFTALGPGTLAYSASYVFDTGATTGSVTIEREDPSNPGTWVVFDVISGVTLGYSYAIQGIYSELYSGNVNYRLTYAWTGNLGVVTWYVRNTFEGGAYTPINDPQIKTDTDAKTVDINDLQFFQNNIRTTVSNTDIVLDPAGSGRVVALSNIVAPTFVGNLNGNADTVTNGVYTTGSYSDPSWITSLDGTKITNAVLTTGSYANPSWITSLDGTKITNAVLTTVSYANPTWITSLDASKIVGSITLSDITIDGDIRIFDNVIQTTLSNSNLELRANGTGVVFIPDNLTVTNSITFNTTTNNQSFTTTGAGTITISSGTLGSINNMQIGNSTRAAGNFTSLDANSTVGLSPANANVTISPTGTGTVIMSPAGGGSLDNFNIGTTTAGSGRFTNVTAVGATNTAAIITPTTALSSTAWTTTGINLRVQARTYTDTSSTAGTVAASYIHALAQPTFASTNAITITNAANLYVASVGAGTNTTITSSWAIWAAGRVYATDFTGTIGNTSANAGSFTILSASTSILSSGTGGIGYSTGAGGTGSQSTAKTDTVIIDEPTGQITMNAASLGANTTVSFTLTNSTIAATDHVVVTHVSGGSLGSYNVTASAAAGSSVIYVRNVTASPLSEAVVLRFHVFKSVNS